MGVALKTVLRLGGCRNAQGEKTPGKENSTVKPGTFLKSSFVLVHSNEEDKWATGLINSAGLI